MPGAPAPRPRRVDAGRNRTAILEAAVRTLNARPDASVDEIARTANLSRQTVYAHFPTREALVTAVVDHITTEVLGLLSEAQVEQLAPVEGLRKVLRLGSVVMTRYPLLMNLPATTQEESLAAHEPLASLMEGVIRRGQRRGDFDRRLPVGWLMSTMVALGHAAGEEVRSGRMSATRAADLLERSVLAVFGATP